MSLWSTRSIDTDREKNYVVIKHKLRDVNGTIHGVKFRGGFAVLDKNTKRYSEIRKLPLLRDTPEFSIDFLRKLKFITRSSDVQVIWGKDVYYHYMKAITEMLTKEAEETKIKKEKEHIEQSNKCNFRASTGGLCSYNALVKSPSGYCTLHIIKDPRLEEVGIKIPKRMTKDQRKEYKEKILKKLDK